jgi:hypothetical protein
MQVILELAEPLSEQEQSDIKYLLTDALGEFASARLNGYVERRYGSHDENFKAAKRKQVEQRLALAGKLREVAFQVKVSV